MSEKSTLRIHEWQLIYAELVGLSVKHTREYMRECELCDSIDRLWRRIEEEDERTGTTERQDLVVEELEKLGNLMLKR